MPTSTHTESDGRGTAVFAAEWHEWHAAHERHRADPHGFLAVTHLPAPGASRTTPSLWFWGPAKASFGTAGN